MALPTTRDYDAVDTGPLPHTTVNAMQDAIVGAQHGEVPIVLDHMGGRVEVGFAFSGTVGYTSSGGASERVSWPIDLPVGTKITKARVSVNQAGATPMTFEIRSLSITGASAVELTEAGDAATGDKVLENTTEVTIGADKSYYLRAYSISQAGDLVRWPEITIKKDL